MKASSDRWLNGLLWALIILVAWKLFVMLTVRPDQPPPVPTNPRELSPTAPAPP